MEAVTKRLSLETVSAAAGCLLLFALAVLPSSYTILAGGLLLASLVLVVLRWRQTREIRIDGSVAAMGVAYVLIGIAFLILGLLNGNSGALSQGRVFVLWPVVYMVLITGIDDVRMLRWIDRTLVVAAFAIGIYAVDFLVVSLKWLPGFAFHDFEQDARIVFYSGYVQFNLNSVASMLFLTPYLMARVLDFTPEDGRRLRMFVVAALIISLMVSLLALRRALLLLVILVAPLLVIALGRLSGSDEGRAYVRRALIVFGVLAGAVALVATAATLTGHLKPANFLGSVLSGFSSSSGSADADVRRRELIALTQGWLRSPLVGHGLGAVASYVRVPDQPWEYELSYNALLLETGVVGATLYAAGTVWIFWQAVILARSTLLSHSIRPIVVGSVCFLLANATNPYLEKFSYLWVLFLPLAYVNYWRVSTRATGQPFDLSGLRLGLWGVRIGGAQTDRDAATSR